MNKQLLRYITILFLMIVTFSASAYNVMLCNKTAESITVNYKAVIPGIDQSCHGTNPNSYWETVTMGSYTVEKAPLAFVGCCIYNSNINVSTANYKITKGYSGNVSDQCSSLRITFTYYTPLSGQKFVRATIERQVPDFTDYCGDFMSPAPR